MADQPSNAPTDLPTGGNHGEAPADARDDATAASILNDDRQDGNPGGGGLGGDDAAGGGIAPTGGPSPNTPADGGVTVGDAGASSEAIRRSTDETTR